MVVFTQEMFTNVLQLLYVDIRCEVFQYTFHKIQLSKIFLGNNCRVIFFFFSSLTVTPYMRKKAKLILALLSFYTL